MISFVRRALSSLEVRLVGALILTGFSVAATHFVSQGFATRLSEDTAAMRQAAVNTQQAQQLEKRVGDFRIAANVYLAEHDGQAGQPISQLTDIAIDIGNQINALRLTGMPVYDLENDDMSFEDLDRHVATIAGAGAAGKVDQTALAPINNRNQEMADLARMITNRAEQREVNARTAINVTTRKWSGFVSLSGTFVTLLVLVMLFDLMANILPAMRRMNRHLADLAKGNLDIEIEDFRLQELKALSGPLETFRRNALAVKGLAFTDASTGLPNRRALLEEAERMLAAMQGAELANVGLIVADIDRFKLVNDDFGHGAADQLVGLIARRMREEIGDRAAVARVGGDEFALCLVLEPGESAVHVASKLIARMREPFDLGGYNVSITMSAGAIDVDASANRDGINTLLDRADLALYAAKNEGRNRAVAFTDQLGEDRQVDRSLESDLAKALNRGELRMVYQPIHSFDRAEQEVEALVRWEHPKLGTISPSRFIPAAERSGLMVQLGAWIIERSLADMQQWPDLALSINLSPLQLQQDGFVPFLLGACRKNDILPQRLILEVTESLSIERNSRALLALELLRNSGFRIALDDFGTGYSSLSMLKTFQFDRLKLDRSLINDLGSDPTAQAVFDAAVTMALRIGAQVVAEGVAQHELIALVSEAGCTHVQGFHFSEPIEASRVAAYFENFDGGIIGETCLADELPPVLRRAS